MPGHMQLPETNFKGTSFLTGGDGAIHAMELHLG